MYKNKFFALIDLLSFVCKVVKCGRIFLPRLIDHSTTVRSLHNCLFIASESEGYSVVITVSSSLEEQGSNLITQVYV